MRPCHRCGYDLEQNPLVSVCPGCMSSPAASSVVLADPRPPARVKDPDALFRFRLEHLGEPCENECGRFGQHVHHKVFRSQGGGDVPENLAWLCHICHSAEHGIRVVP